MDPSTQFCPNYYCLKRGLFDQGHLKVHSHKERRFRCTCCGKTFAASRNTPFFRLHKSVDLVTVVLTLLSHGCPLQAAVAAYGLDERTVADWQRRAGDHAQRFHQLHVQQARVDAQHVQADELYVKMVGHKRWLAMALAVPSRLWLGGVLGPRRNQALIDTLVGMVRSCLQSLAILVCVDGLAGYVGAFVRGFRNPVQGWTGRPCLVTDAGLLIGQVIKRYSGKRLVGTVRRVVRGSAEAIQHVLQRTQTGTQINTAYVERLNATFRANLSGLVRRGRALLHEPKRMQAGLYLLGCVYNFCWPHDSLRTLAPAGNRQKWVNRTPAQAAGLTDRRWTVRQLLEKRLPPALWKAPRKKRCYRRAKPVVA